MGGENRQSGRERALLAVNRAFYRDHADTFDATRGTPWPGWSRVLDHLDPEAPQSILDIGCGNGRLVPVIAERFPQAHYTGVDASLGLLAAARRQAAAGGGAKRLVLGCDALATALPIDSDHTLVALFGVLHHVPSVRTLDEVMGRAFDRVQGGGVLALSFWQFADLPRFHGKALPAAAADLEDGVLEKGDYLLPWQRAVGAVRYCRAWGPAEATAAAARLPGEVIDTFRADGATGGLNLYLLVRKP